MSVAPPNFAPETFQDACRNLRETALQLGVLSATSWGINSGGHPELSEAWHGPQGYLSDEIAAIGSSAALTDTALANWWSEGCSVREVVWAVAATGGPCAVDWLTWMLSLSKERHQQAFCGLLAVDLCDVSRVAMASAHGDDVAAVLGAERSPARLLAWLDNVGIRPASTLGDGQRPEGTQTVTGAWLHGQAASEHEHFDVMIDGAISGAAIVVELDGLYRRHVLLSAGATEPESIDSDHFCVNLAHGRSGWLTRLGKWTWMAGPATCEPSPDVLPIVWRDER